MYKFSSITQSCLTPCDPIDCSRPSLPVHNQLPEVTQTHVHWVGDAIQPSHPLSSPSPAPNPSQHQSLFKWVSSSHQVAKVLEFQLQHQSFQRIPRADLLQNGLVGSSCSPRDSQESSPTPQFKSINSSALSLLLVNYLAWYSELPGSAVWYLSLTEKILPLKCWNIFFCSFFSFFFWYSNYMLHFP